MEKLTRKDMRLYIKELRVVSRKQFGWTKQMDRDYLKWVMSNKETMQSYINNLLHDIELCKDDTHPLIVDAVKEMRYAVQRLQYRLEICANFNTTPYTDLFPIID